MKVRASLLAIVALLALACAGGQETAAPAAEAETPAETPASDAAGSHDLLMARLKAADLVDGTEDKVVERCSGCGLVMDGNADHAIQHEGYELHFCSDGCQDKFSENTTEALLAMDLPAPETE